MCLTLQVGLPVMVFAFALPRPQLEELLGFGL
jgi:hypothetical protein